MEPTSPLKQFCVWVTSLAWLNLCWWGLTLAGLGVGGVIPASVVTLQMMRRYLLGAPRVRFASGFALWRQEWLRSNLVIWPLLGLVLGLVWLFAQLGSEGLAPWQLVLLLSALPLALLLALLGLACLLELSVWQCSVTQAWRNGVLLLLQQPLLVLVTALGCSLLLTLCLLKPIVGIFFLFSPVALMSMAFYLRVRPQLFEEQQDYV